MNCPVFWKDVCVWTSVILFVFLCNSAQWVAWEVLAILKQTFKHSVC